MRKIIKITGVAAVVVGALLSAGCNSGKVADEAATLVRTQTIKSGGAGQGSVYAGEVRGRYETTLAFQVGGKIISRKVELGSVVSPGDVLMELDPKDIQQTVNISAAQTYSAQSQLNLAAGNLERYRKLYEQGAVSRAQYDNYQNAYDAAVAAVRQASAQYAQGSNQLGYSVLTADAPGVISGINVEAGQVVSAGQPVAVLVQDGEREIEINVPENRIDEVRKIQQVRVTFWALPSVAANGRIREISPVADKVSRTYKVRITLTNPPAEIKLGMTASVAMSDGGSDNNLYIPLAAIYQNGNMPCVWVINNGTATLRPIQVGAFGDGKIQVTSGLGDGETIVTAGVHKLREGQKVRAEGDLP